MKAKTRTQAKAGLDLGMMAAEETPQGKVISKGIRVTKDAYELYTGRPFKMPLTWQEKLEKEFSRRERAFDRRMERR